MSASRSNLKTSLPSAHAASTQMSQNMRRASPKRNVSRQQKGPPTKPDADPRHLAIALHHAHRIQAQKDTESLILSRILELVTFPSSPSADPASPSPEDARAFKSALIPFQPADYDNLIQERNIEGLCGYGLCPREHRKDDSRGTYRITWGAKGSGPGGRGREMNIVPREKLEMWCSDECAERALYIRVQLAEEPVWERRADDARGKNLLLLEEGRARTQRGKGKAATVEKVTGQLGNLHMTGTPGSSDLTSDMSNLSVHDGSHSHELALERGDANPALRAGRVDVQIQEKDNIPYEHVAAPEMRPGDDKGGSIEGYVPQEF
ncbi:Rtr1/RPAP2 family protein phosphatase [Aspergillus alliaceus]|uniref:Rtr1/RPAP2 family protein phosphatase n=1 Tax=Petromyces alliaceus TaxID=209559 RepID=UPI0012A4AD5D|nr:Rtr1/RPAP2 family-domain-containing protein [Aspergillus alliaceus]KAB8233343.1 Rtr1/RPAP2 family-domain-containing protein [Aspergillus alliaceus]